MNEKIAPRENMNAIFASGQSSGSNPSIGSSDPLNRTCRYATACPASLCSGCLALVSRFLR